MATTEVYNCKKKKGDEEYKRGKGGCETALLPASFSMHCLWFVGDMKTAMPLHVVNKPQSVHACLWKSG